MPKILSVKKCGSQEGVIPHPEGVLLDLEKNCESVILWYFLKKYQPAEDRLTEGSEFTLCPESAPSTGRYYVSPNSILVLPLAKPGKKTFNRSRLCNTKLVFYF